MPARLTYLKGYKFPDTRLTYVSDAPDHVTPSGNRFRKITVKCDCGNIFDTQLSPIRDGRTKSCRCYNNDRINIHGFSEHPLYKVYKFMISRCYDKSAHDYENYGGRGITVCNEWKKHINLFIDYCDSLPKHLAWKPGFQLDRIDNNQGYKPGNVRFVTSSKNMRNTRINLYVKDFDGLERLLIDIVERESIKGRIPIGIDYINIAARISYGWTLTEALYLPLQKYYPRTSVEKQTRRDYLRRNIEKKRSNRRKHLLEKVRCKRGM
jgi:hypothetical protein